MIVCALTSFLNRCLRLACNIFSSSRKTFCLLQDALSFCCSCWTSFYSCHSISVTALDSSFNISFISFWCGVVWSLVTHCLSRLSCIKMVLATFTCGYLSFLLVSFLCDFYTRWNHLSSFQFLLLFCFGHNIIVFSPLELLLMRIVHPSVLPAVEQWFDDQGAQYTFQSLLLQGLDELFRDRGG